MSIKIELSALGPYKDLVLKYGPAVVEKLLKELMQMRRGDTCLTAEDIRILKDRLRTPEEYENGQG